MRSNRRESRHPICWYSSPWLHAVLVFFLGILVSACGKNASITDGSYMGLTIGSDKAKAFERVEELATVLGSASD